MNSDTARSKIETELRERVSTTPDLHSAHLLVHSDSLGIHWPMAVGGSDEDPAHPDQPYHAMSVGKTFTATIVTMLAEEGKLAIEDPIAEYLCPEILDGLHVYDGTDYTYEITIEHLLSHTSGLPHLLEDEFGLLRPKPEVSADGKSFLDVMLEAPDRFFDPEETVLWATEHLEPHFPPGEGIFYSEVGYNLLGLVIESVTDLPYDEALSSYLFEPLSMEQSYLAQFSEPIAEPEHPVAPFHIGDREFDVESFRASSGWFAGGQTVNTTEDLLAFHRALLGGELVSSSSLDRMTQWRRLSVGFDYGHGMVRFRPLPLLSKYHLQGGLGASGSYMLYSPRLDVHLVGNFHQWSYMKPCMRFLFQVLRILSKVDPFDVEGDSVTAATEQPEQDIGDRQRQRTDDRHGAEANRDTVTKREEQDTEVVDS